MKGKGKGKKKREADLPSSEDIKARIDAVRNLDLDVSPLRKQLSRYKKERSADVSKAKKTLKNIEDGLNRAWNEWNASRATVEMDLIDSAFEICEGKGMDCTDLKTSTRNLRTKVKKGFKDDVQAGLKELRQGIASALDPFPDVIIHQAISAFNRGLDSYIDMSGSGPSLGTSRKYFKKTWDYARKKDVDKLIVYSNLLLNSSQTEITDEEAKDRFKVIKDQLNGLRERVQEFDEFGLETGTIFKQIDRIEKGFDSKHIAEYEGHISGLDKSVARLESEYLRKKGDVGLMESKGLFERYGNLLDLSSYIERYDKLIEDQGKMSPNRFFDESSSLLHGIKEDLLKNFREQVLERIERIDRFLEEAPEGTLDRVAPIKELKDLSNSHLLSGDITEAMEYLSMAENMIGYVEDEIELGTLRENYSLLLQDYQALMDDNVEIAELGKLLNDIEHLFLSDDVRRPEIIERIADGKAIIGEKMAEVRNARFTKGKDEILSSLSSFDIDDDKKKGIIKLLDGLGSDLASVDEETFRKRFSQIETSMDALMEEYFKDNYPDFEGRINELADSVEGLGGDVNKVRSSIGDASSLFANGKFVEAGKLLRAVEMELMGMEKDAKVRKVEAGINSAEFMFEEARRAGVEVEDYKLNIEEAKRYLDEGLISEAIDLSSKIESDIKGKWMDQRRERLFGEILTLKDVVGQADSTDQDLGEFAELIDQAESLFREGKYDDANEMMIKARDGMENSRKQFFSESAMRSINSTREKIREVADMGVSTLEVETLLMEAERSFLNEDYEESFRKTLEIDNKLMESKSMFMRDEIPRTVSELSMKVERLESMGLDASSPREVLERSKQNLRKGLLEDSILEVSKARELVDDLYRSHVSLTIPESIVDIRKQIDEAMGLGIEMEGLLELVETAEEMFVKEDYDSALSKIEEVQTNIKKEKSGFFRDQFLDKVQNVEELMNNTEGIDREINLSKDNINMARDAFERGDFEASHALLDRVLNYIQDSLTHKEEGRKKDVVMSQFDEVKLLIEVARSENVDVSAETNILKMSYDLLEKGELSQAEQVIQGIKKGVQEKRLDMKRELIESSVQTTEILLENMQDMGMDVTIEMSLMKDLKEAMRRGDLDLCDDINRKLEDTLRRNRAPYTVQKLQKDITSLRARALEAENLGIDTTGIRKMITDAQGRFDKGDLDGAQKVIHEADRTLDIAFEGHRKKEFESQMRELEEKIEIMMQSAIPVDDEMSLKEQCISLLEEGDLEQASMWLNTALIGANAKITSFQRSTAEGWISQIAEYLQSLKDIGLDIADLERIFQEGKDLHKGGNDNKAISKFSSILELGEEKRKRHLEKNITGVFKRMRKRFDDLKGIGLEPSQEMAGLVEDMAGAISSGKMDFASLDEKLTRLRLLMETEGSKYMERLAKTHIEEATKRYKDMKEKGTTDDRILSMMKEAGRLYREGNLFGADDVAFEIFERMDRLALEESEEAVKGEMKTVQQMITRLKTMGSNVENVEQLFSRAELALKGGKVKGAKKIISSIRESIKEIVNRNMRESARETIEFTEAMINYLTDNFTGISLKLAGAMDALNTAKEEFQKKRYKTSSEKAQHARQLVERVDHTNIDQFLYVFRSSQATEFISELEQRITELSKKGVDVSKANLLLDNARKFFDNDQFEKGREIVIVARILLSEMDAQTLRDQAFDVINDAHVGIISAKKKGDDVRAADKVMTTAKEAFAIKDYKKAILLAKKALFQLNKA
ncbi:MAG: hypothetical protein QCI82_08995 [Candidatus Thermoplasmatota archaeon]|nr:hypothetical protein [Candidatus Thermoplasmatota archaeon]